MTESILELDRRIGEIAEMERVLATWPSGDEESAFVRALQAIDRRLYRELAEAHAVSESRVEPQFIVSTVGAPAACPETEIATLPANGAESRPEAGPTSSGIEPLPRNGEAHEARQPFRDDMQVEGVATRPLAVPPPRLSFHTPTGRDFEVTQGEWDAIQVLLSSRSSDLPGDKVEQ